MKLYFILHGFHPLWTYDSKAKYAVCWRATDPFVPSNGPKYEKHLLAFVDTLYDKCNNILPWLNYKLKKLL